MSDHHLPRVARRILNKPQLISEPGAIAVLGAIAPRLGVSRMIDVGGAMITFGNDVAEATLPAKEARNAGAPERDWDSDKPFAFDVGSGIAYIPIEGELVHRFGHIDPYSGMTGYDAVKLKVQAAAEDPAVKGILLDIDSPGGEIFGADGTAEAIFAARAAKPIWALANEMALSAGYWLASAAHNVFAPATADLGSIGVVMMHVDWSRALDADGITVTFIHAGAHKVDGDPFHPLPDDVRAVFQTEVETIRTLFAAKVARNRGISEEVVLDTEARIFMGPAAVDAGLADAVGSEDEVLAEFAERLAQPARVLLT